MTEQKSSIVVFNDLGLIKELEDPDFRNQFFRAEREIDIPSQIKNLRKLRNMKQTQLAEIAGTKQSAISRIERSQEQKWELETLVKLSEALGARLSVVIEPYENVIARYRSDEVRPVTSAAFAKIDTRPNPPSAANANPNTIELNKSEKYGTTGNRKQSGDLANARTSPERASLSA